MTLDRCLNTKIRFGRVDRTRGERAIDLYNRLVEHNARTMSREMAEAAAGARIEDILARDAARRRRVRLLQAQATQRIVTDIESHPAGVVQGAMGVLVRDLDDLADYANVDTQRHVILGRLHAKWAEGLAALRSRAAGLVKNVALAEDVVREIFGEGTGNATARELARSWAETAEYARRLFNEAGGDIPKRADWGLPHTHDPLRVARVSKAEWINFVLPLLDRAKMVDFETGVELSDAQLLELLDRVYDRIRTNGLIDLEPGQFARGKKLANRHQDARILVFRNADAWIEYNNRFGTRDIFSTMVAHLDHMAKDIALLQVLGPDPDAMVRFLADRMRLAGAGGVRIKTFEDTYRALTGAISRPDDVGLHAFFQGVRNYLTAAKLGGAFITSLGDVKFIQKTAAFNGLPATRVLGRLLSLMNPKNEADRLLAVRLGLIAEAWSQSALAAQRWNVETMGVGFSARFADFTLRATLLTPWTQAGKWAFGLEFLSFLADHVGKGFYALPPALRRAMERYGIDARDWEIARKVPLLAERGVRFIDPNRIVEAGHLDAADKIQRMILTEANFAVVTPDARVRAILTQGTQSGTIMGEVMRSAAMFKSFPVSVITTHLYRGAAQLSPLQKTAYIADLVIGLTVMGAITWQMKQILDGKDPADMTGSKFWMAAALQGGGLGIYGDFLFSDVNRFGRGPVMTLAGPIAELGQDVTKLTLGNIQQLVRGEQTNLGREIVRFIDQNSPGGSAWYSRLVMDRLIIERLRQLVDPDAHRSFLEMERRARRDFNQRYWWRPGRTAPDRGPELERVLGG